MNNELTLLERIAVEVDGLDMSAELWDDIHAAIAAAHQQSNTRHPDCLAEGCQNLIHHGHICRDFCEANPNF